MSERTTLIILHLIIQISDVSAAYPGLDGYVFPFCIYIKCHPGRRKS